MKDALKYAVVIEHGPTSIGAYPPDLPGCGASASSLADVMVLIGESIAFHLEGLYGYGSPIPGPKLTTDEALAYHVAALAEMGESPSEMDTAAEVDVPNGDPNSDLPVLRASDGQFDDESMIHSQFRHDGKVGAVTMSGDLDTDFPPGTFNNIILPTELDLEAFDG